ncbi:hypothetical protein GCM10018952_01930 [Streptosporangium vulgare]
MAGPDRLGSRLVILSTVYAVTRRLLSLPAPLPRRSVSKDAELPVLRHQNAVLRRQVSWVRYEPAERLWPATLSHLIPRRSRWAEIFPVTPATGAPQRRRSPSKIEKPQLSALNWGFDVVRRQGLEPRTR